jgi:hypothetical protein
MKSFRNPSDSETEVDLGMWKEIVDSEIKTFGTIHDRGGFYFRRVVLRVIILLTRVLAAYFMVCGASRV